VIRRRRGDGKKQKQDNKMVGGVGGAGKKKSPKKKKNFQHLFIFLSPVDFPPPMESNNTTTSDFRTFGFTSAPRCGGVQRNGGGLGVVGV